MQWSLDCFQYVCSRQCPRYKLQIYGKCSAFYRSCSDRYSHRHTLPPVCSLRGCSCKISTHMCFYICMYTYMQTKHIYTYMYEYTFLSSTPQGGDADLCGLLDSLDPIRGGISGVRIWRARHSAHICLGHSHPAGQVFGHVQPHHLPARGHEKFLHKSLFSEETPAFQKVKVSY